ncbi:MULTISPECIES: sugar-binding protein [Bacillaceae]|uniref:sugar-binding protein n=1 Tax=Bacillaceae TaxID=186817 RepID=UPI001F319FC6|nr:MULTISPECIES: sugar-binding protein [Bacillaceae]
MKVRGRLIIYVLLIATLIGSAFLSLFYYLEVKNYEEQMLDIVAKTPMPAHHLVLISEELDHEYWKLVEAGAKQAEDYYDVFVEFTGPQNSNQDEQVRLLEMAIAKRVDGIIVQALNDELFTPLINKALVQGIPVVTIDTDEPNSYRISYIGTDNYRSGKLAGHALIADLEGEAVVGIIANSLASTHMQQRVQGFKDAVEDEPGIQVVTIEESNNSRVGASEKADKMLKTYPHITAFYGTSALDGLGVVSTVTALNRDDIYIVAFDTLDETLALLDQGKIDAVVAQEPFEMGYRSVGIMLDIINGKEVDKVYHTSTSIIRKEDLKNGFQIVNDYGQVEIRPW